MFLVANEYSSQGGSISAVIAGEIWWVAQVGKK